MKDSDVNVFIIEDNEMYSAFLVEIFTNRVGVNVQVFQTGEAMISALKSGNKPHIIVSDYYFDGEVSNALELFRQLREMAPEIPLVILTAQSDLEIAEEMLKEGVFDFLVKDENAFRKIVSTLKRAMEVLKMKPQRDRIDNDEV